MADKRTEQRHRKRVRAIYGVKETNRIAFTEDLSQEGLFLRTSIVHPPSTLLEIEIPNTEGEVVRIEGRVQWAKKVPPNMLRKIRGGMGIKILQIHSGAESFLRLMEKREERRAVIL